MANRRLNAETSYSFSRAIHWSSVTVLYTAMVGVVSLSTALVLVLANFGQIRSDLSTLTAAFLSMLAGSIALSVTTLQYSQRRRDRQQSVRLAETHGREAEMAVLLAEAVSNAARANASDLDAFIQNARFISQWARVEDRLRRFAHVSIGIPAGMAVDYPISALLDRLTKARVLTPAQVSDVRAILDVRNRLAHGRSASASELAEGRDLMDSVETYLDGHLTPEPPVPV